MEAFPMSCLCAVSSDSDLKMINRTIWVLLHNLEQCDKCLVAVTVEMSQLLPFKKHVWTKNLTRYLQFQFQILWCRSLSAWKPGPADALNKRIKPSSLNPWASRTPSPSPSPSSVTASASPKPSPIAPNATKAMAPTSVASASATQAA